MQSKGVPMDETICFILLRICYNRQRQAWAMAAASDPSSDHEIAPPPQAAKVWTWHSFDSPKSACHFRAVNSDHRLKALS